MFLRSYYISGLIPVALDALFHFIFTITLGNRHYYYPHRPRRSQGTESNLLKITQLVSDICKLRQTTLSFYSFQFSEDFPAVLVEPDSTKTSLYKCFFLIFSIPGTVLGSAGRQETGTEEHFSRPSFQ